LAKNDEALKLLIARPVGSDYYSFAYLDFLHAECMMRKLDMGAAMYYTEFINTFTGRKFFT